MLERHNHPPGAPCGWLLIVCEYLAKADDNQSPRQPRSAGGFRAAANRELSHGLCLTQKVKNKTTRQVLPAGGFALCVSP